MAVVEVLFWYKYLKAEPEAQDGLSDKRPSLKYRHSLTWDVRAGEFILPVYLLSAVCVRDSQGVRRRRRSKQDVNVALPPAHPHPSPCSAPKQF